MHGDRERVVHRLEAFSDIVIGFSLAQIAVNLVVPARASDFLQHPAGMLGFIITFAVVANFWWVHFTMFRHYFVPTRIAVVLNFFALAAVVLQVYALQLWLHFSRFPHEANDAAKIYFGIGAISYTILAVLFALGLRARWDELTAALRAQGVRRVIRLACLVAGIAIGIGYAGMPGAVRIVDASSRQDIAQGPFSIALGIVGGVILGRIVSLITLRALHLGKTAG